MLIPCPACPVRRQAAFRPFSPSELGFVTRAKSGQLDFAPREPIVHEGDAGHQMLTVLSGWAFRHKTLTNGARQILDFLLPGDPVGLQSQLTGKVRHNVDALTEVTVCEIAVQPLRDLFQAQPALASALMATLLLDEDRADRRLLLLGRQRPSQRLAYLMLELHDRLQLRGLGDDSACAFPLTYGHMADALGLSRAQLARSLGELRDRNWASLHGGELQIGQPKQMAEFCAYDAETTKQRRAII